MRLVDADDLKEHITQLILVYRGVRLDNAIIEAIDNAPTIPQPEFKDGYKQAIIDGKTNYSRPEGEWIDYDNTFYKCPECGYLLEKCCPECQTKVILPKGGAE